MPALRDNLVFALGNPLLDIQATVDLDLLKKYGLKENDAILCDDKLVPLFKEMADKYNPEYLAGGATENSARIAQWILNRPNTVAFAGCIGNDEYGKILEQKVKSVGVNPIYMIHPTEKTGTCAVCITGVSRSLCAHLAAANHFKKDHLDQNWKLVESAEFYYVAGFHLTVSPDSMVAIGEHAAATNKTFTFNLSAPFLVSVFKQQMLQVLPYVDILFGNETEAAEFAKEHNFGTTSVPEIALKLAALPKTNSKRSRIAVITQGSDSVVVARDGKLTEIPVQKLGAGEIVDTNGAGDAFVGGFLAQWIQDKSMEEAVRCGIWAAQVIIRNSGCSHPAKCDFK